VTLATPALIGVLQKIIAPYPIPTPVLQATLVAVSPAGLAAARASVESLKSERTRVTAALNKISTVRRVWPSDSNFILFEVPDAGKVMAATRAAGVVLRDRSRDYGLANNVRITMGTPEENNTALEAITHV
jgi:histidinol-phosphate aminotransferase